LESHEQGDTLCRFPACNHTFHKGCLAEWLRRRPLCPNCRGAIHA
jgi:hypothetical protein